MHLRLLQLYSSTIRSVLGNGHFLAQSPLLGAPVAGCTSHDLWRAYDSNRAIGRSVRRYSDRYHCVWWRVPGRVPTQTRFGLLGKAALGEALGQTNRCAGSSRGCHFSLQDASVVPLGVK